MTQLTKSAAALTEALRFGRKPEAEACFAQVKLDYNMTAEAIRRLAAGAALLFTSCVVLELTHFARYGSDAVLLFTAYVCGS